MVEKANQGRTLERALDVIASVERSRGPIRLAQIAKETGLHIATTQRIVGTLVRRAYLQASDVGYTLGPEVLANAHGFLSQDRLTLVARPVLATTSSMTGLTVSLWVRSGWSRVLLARAEAPEVLAYRFPVGQRLPLDVGAGKVLLAYLDADELDAYLDDYAVQRLADGRPQADHDLRDDLARIRATGGHESVSERHVNAVSIAVPVLDTRGLVLGVVNLVAEAPAASLDDLRQHRGQLVAAAREIGEQM